MLTHYFGQSMAGRTVATFGGPESPQRVKGVGKDLPDFHFRHLHVLKYDVCTAKAMYPREKCVVWGWQAGGEKLCVVVGNTSPGNRKQKDLSSFVQHASNVPFPSHYYMRGAGTGLHCIDFFHPPWCSCLQQGRYQSCAERGVSTQSAFESDTKGARQEASLPQILLPLSLHKRRRNHTQHHTQDAWTTTWWSILAGVSGRRSLKAAAY
jgi:hypothetical protein